MLSLPKSTEFNKRIPKQKFYDNLDISPTLKKAFIQQIQAVYWRNKLAPATMNISAGKQVTELEVFEIVLTSQEVNEAVLRQIDREIPYHILFILTFGNKSRFAVSYTEPTESGKNAFQVGRYFWGSWVECDKLSVQLNGLDLDTVLENMIREIGNIHVTEGNSLGQQIEVNAQREKLEKEIERLERLARKEVQPRKKYELVKRIKELKTNQGKNNEFRKFGNECS